jgi:hypothetical protein
VLPGGLQREADVLVHEPEPGLIGINHQLIHQRAEAAEERHLARADREQAKADCEAQLEEAAGARREAAEQHERNLAELARQRAEDERATAEQRAKDQRYRAITITISVVALLVSGGFGTYTALKPAPAPQVIVVPSGATAPQLPTPR